MAIVRNNLVAEGKVLEELKKYAADLQQTLTEEGSSSIKDATAHINNLKDNYNYPEESIQCVKDMLALRRKHYAEYMELVIAVNAILGQNAITEEQQALLTKNFDSNRFSASTKQFITSYLKNYTDAKQVENNNNAKQVNSADVEAKIYERANAFFTAEDRAKAVFTVEDRANAFFAKAKGPTSTPATKSDQPKAKGDRSTNKPQF